MDGRVRARWWRFRRPTVTLLVTGLSGGLIAGAVFAVGDIVFAAIRSAWTTGFGGGVVSSFPILAAYAFVLGCLGGAFIGMLCGVGAVAVWWLIRAATPSVPVQVVAVCAGAVGGSGVGFILVFSIVLGVAPWWIGVSICAAGTLVLGREAFLALRTARQLVPPPRKS